MGKTGQTKKERERDQAYADALFETFVNPAKKEQFSQGRGDVGDVEGHFYLAKPKKGKPREVLLVLTPAIREIIKDAIDTLFDPDEDEEDVEDDLEDEDDEDDEDESDERDEAPRRRVRGFEPL